jgi:hypothetical protein
MRRQTLSAGIGMVCIGMLVAGCATTITKPTAAPQPCKEKLGTFAAVEMEHVTLAPASAGAGANQKAAKKIDELLASSLRNIFPGMKVVDKAGEAPAAKTLVIRPQIKEIKFIGGAARFWVGAMAGSSAVLMQMDYVNKNTGDVLASAQFYRSANAFGGGMSMGGSDNMMLSEIVQDITTYTISNR